MKENFWLLYPVETSISVSSATAPNMQTYEQKLHFYLLRIKTARHWAYLSVGLHTVYQGDYDGRGQQTASPMFTAIMQSPKHTTYFNSYYL